jgi:methyl-accepting chemotaxis protein
MTDFKNRLGHDNFVWWIGVVEDRFDPLYLGRCRVRIFGSHTDNLQEIPTADLPWATPIYPVNDSRSFSTPMEGDYVFGFFMDGTSSQAPAMLGVFPAIPQKEPDEETGKGFTATAKYVNSQISEEDAVKPIVYTDTPSMKPVRVGKPTTQATAYTYKGTGIEKSDNSRAHVCDIPGVIKYQAAVEALKNSTIFQGIRNGIEALTTGTASSPIITGIISGIKVLRGILRTINELLDFINNIVKLIAEFIVKVQRTIAWFLSLPARLLQQFSDCLASLYSSLAGVFTSAIDTTASSFSQLITEGTGLISDVTKTISGATSTLATASTLVSTAETTLNPNSYSGRI